MGHFEAPILDSSFSLRARLRCKHYSNASLIIGRKYANGDWPVVTAPGDVSCRNLPN